MMLLPALSGCGDADEQGMRIGWEAVGRTSSALTQKCSTPSNGPVQGRDVSRYQGTFDWAAQKAQGVVFGYARINYGTSDYDVQWTRNWAEMKKHGILRGGYQYFLAGSDPVAQANIVVKAVGKLGVGDLPVMLDLEEGDGQSAAVISANAKRWLDIVEKGTGKRPTIYTGGYFWQDNVNDPAFGKYPLFIAAYIKCPLVPEKTWKDWTFWQYSDGNGTLDHDVFNGTLAQLQALAGATQSASEVAYAYPDYPSFPGRSDVDVDGDGASDVCARGPEGIVCELGGASPLREIKGPAWSDKVWGEASYATTVQFGDIDGDGKSDVCGRRPEGVVCQRSTGTGFGDDIVGPDFSDESGWSSETYYPSIRLADVNGDGKADVCGRKDEGIRCYLSDGKGFPTEVKGPEWITESGFGEPKYGSSIQYGDINGDGKADVCMRRRIGIECWTSDGAGLPNKVMGPEWSDDAGFDGPTVVPTVKLVDLNGDGKSDVCVRSTSGMRCALSNGDSFGAEIQGPPWSDASGWNRPAYYGSIFYADVNGDAKMDVCGRDSVSVVCSTFDGATFSEPFKGPAWGDDKGWNEPAAFVSLGAADVNHDGLDDVCGRNKDGFVCALSTGNGFGEIVPGPAWSDDAGWNKGYLAASIRYVGDANKKSGAKPGGGGEGSSPNNGEGQEGAGASSDDGGCTQSARPARTSAGGYVSLVALGLVLARRRRRFGVGRA